MHPGPVCGVEGLGWHLVRLQLVGLGQVLRAAREELGEAETGGMLSTGPAPLPHPHPAVQ